MRNLTLLEQEALEILKQLERCCESIELHNPEYVKKEKKLAIMFSDLDFSVLKKGENIRDVEKYLQKYEVDFHITFDLENDLPITHIDREHPTEDFIELGMIKGENIQGIKTKIKDLIHKLSTEGPAPEIGVFVKNKKRVTLPKFRREEWSKISIKFLDDRNFLLSDPRDTKPCSPESIGCLDERDQRPDDAWEFLKRVANGNGTTDPIDKKEREKQKKHKQKITDILRTIFENDTDPFEKEKGGVYKAKFSIGYIEADTPKTKKKKEYLDLEEVRKEMTGE